MLVQLECILQMGQCSCCPLIFNRKASTDSLSIDMQHPSLEVELPDKLSKIDKKISQNQIKILKKQESIYFKKNNRLNIKNESLSSKIAPMVHSESKQFELSPTLDHSELYCRVKGKIKPNIQKISTMDEETSSQNQYFNNREDFSESNEESFIEGQAGQRNKIDMTFTANQEAVVISHQFWTLKEEVKEGEDLGEKMQKLKERVKDEHLSAEQRCQLYYQLGKYHCEIHKYVQSRQYLENSYQLTKDVKSYALKFDTIALLGYVLLVQENFNEAIAYLLKAVRMEVNKQAGESMRLVELYYWLGQSYLRLKKTNLAKDYLAKAMRGYKIYKIEDSQLHKMLYLQLGTLYHNEEQFVEADRCFTRGIKIVEESKLANKYLQLLLKKAENYFAMESHKLCISAFASTFKAMRKYNLTELPIHQQAKTSLMLALKAIAEACISQGELASIIKSAEECMHDLQQVKVLKARLKKMRAILYKQ